MRHIDGCLGKPLEPLAIELIEQDRQDNRNREAEQQSVEVEQEGVGEHASAVIGRKELLKYFLCKIHI